MPEINPEEMRKVRVKIAFKMSFVSHDEMAKLVEQMRHAAEALGRPIIWECTYERTDDPEPV